MRVRSMASKTDFMKEARLQKQKKLKKYRFLYLALAFIVMYYLLFQYIPILWGFLISFKDFKVGGTIMGGEMGRDKQLCRNFQGSGYASADTQYPGYQLFPVTVYLFPSYTADDRHI